MSLRELTLRVAAADVPRAEALLELAGAESLSLGDAADDPILEPAPNETPLWPAVELRALFPEGADLDAIGAVLASACESAHAFSFGALDEDAWRVTAQRGIPPRRFGERLWLAPAGDTAVPAGLVGLRLHMGLAFGTGEHPTTALCLEWLDAHVEPGARVLDYGCGTGVLALAALALGAQHAWAVDNDPQAVMATRANAALNGREAEIFVGAPEALPPLRADVVLANILAGPLIALAPKFARQLVPGGRVVLSGILARQAASVAGAYEPWFERIVSLERDGWTRLDGTRRPE
ncbi:MAG TPA: 50S ribosomal protein L11 methyltransferase [Gammaproteobacteria bacterium]|nr:50S ribosomal protein L11 methyltransferase [Gammaproteobacteria bacterium]